MIINLIEGIEFPLTVDAEFIYLQEASQKVVLRFESSGRYINLHKGAVYRDNEKLEKMFLSGAGQIEVEFGYGNYTPPIDGQAIQITDMPETKIAAGQSVEVTQAAPIEIAAGQSLEVTQTAPVEIAAGQSVEVTQAAPMEIAAGQSVEVTQAAPMEIAAGQSVAVTASGLFSTALIDTFPHAQPENLNRSKIIIRAAAGNLAPIVLGGVYELYAGEFIELETTAEINMTATAPDTAQIIEV